MKNSIYKLDLPYPKIQSRCANLHDVRCIIDDYAGKESECTAIMQYTYQHLISEEQSEEIAEALMGISITEMQHFEYLGEAITQMHGDPVIGGSRQFWNGAFVNYTKDIRQFLQNNIKAEEQAIINYKKSIACVRDADLKALLQRIILDEELHIKIFKELLTKVTPQPRC